MTKEQILREGIKTALGEMIRRELESLTKQVILEKISRGEMIYLSDGPEMEPKPRLTILPPWEPSVMTGKETLSALGT